MSEAHVDQIFNAALGCETHQERKAYLLRATEGEPELRERVEELLAAHASAGDFLGRAAIDLRAADREQGGGTAASPAPAEGPGTRIGAYRLREKLGEGGFGIVYLADQEQPVRREVALKILKLGMDTAQVIARFEAERQALALTEHPNIARVLDAGATATGRPYFVMELVRGMALCQYCDRHRLPLDERLGLFVDVCRAIQHAHQRGLIHRDLKPSNVLVTVSDGRATPKVIDFGIAKATHQRLTEHTLHTAMGQIMGTPVYMSPEQAEMSGLDVDTRTDVYSLGAVLYELLTGVTPFDAQRLRDAGPAGVQRILREEEPPQPSLRVQRLGPAIRENAQRRSLDPGVFAARLRGDLDWIVGRAMEKDRTRRYESAEALAADVQRHLANEPVLAGPPSATYVLKKFVRRHRVMVTAGTVAVLALLGGSGFALHGYLRAQQRSTLATQIIEGKLGPVEAVALTRRVLGARHAAVPAMLSIGAGRLAESGDLDGAQRLYEEALEAWRRLYPEGNLDLALAHARLGSLLAGRGELEGARAHLGRALEIGEALPGGPGPALCAAREDLAKLLTRQGDHDGAARHLRVSLEVRQASFPDEHEILGTTLDRLAGALERAGHHQEAAARRKQAIAEHVLAFPESHVTADRQIAYAATLKAFGQRSEAERQLRKGIAFYRTQPQLQWESYLVGLTALQEILAGSARPEDRQEVDDLQAEMVELARKVYGPSSLELARSLVRSAEWLAGRGFDYRATRLQREAFEIHRGLLGEAFDPDTFLRALHGLAEKIVQRRQAGSEAYELAAEVIDLMILHEPDRADLHDLRSAALMRLERFDEARRSLSEPVAGSEPRPVQLALLAIVQHRLGQASIARSLLRQAREASLRSRFRDDPTVEAVVSEASALIDGKE